MALAACQQPSPTPQQNPPPVVDAVASPLVATTTAVPQTSTAGTGQHPKLLVANHAAANVSLVEPSSGSSITIPAVDSPWGVVLSPDARLAYVSGAQAVAVIDLERRERAAVMPYLSPIGRIDRGEYREGGMGIDVSPDGKRLFVGVHLRSGPGRLEVFDTATRTLVAAHQVGIRPFQVIAAADNRTAYTLDHDGYSVTVVDAVDGVRRTLPAAPLGRGAYDKPHYGALTHAGQLLLPYQGRVLQTLDPRTGQSTTRSLSAATHQHGVALTPDGQRLVIVGTGPAGGVNGGPSLSVVDLLGTGERVFPLQREHELVAISPDGQLAYLTGGYLLNGGWDGITVVNLATGATRELTVPARPLGIAVAPAAANP